jgi:enamine deaminase RidA (YjgF/YER057c/UK114 family)
MTITHINPAALHRNPVFSQATLAEGRRTLFVGEQNGTDTAGALVEGGALAQAAQALRNVLAVLAEVGADASNVVKLTIYYDRHTTLNEIYPAAAEVWGANPTAVTVLQVHALGREGAHVGIEAIAVV